jgi:hypothetical protein
MKKSLITASRKIIISLLALLAVTTVAFAADSHCVTLHYIAGEPLVCKRTLGSRTVYTRTSVDLEKGTSDSSTITASEYTDLLKANKKYSDDEDRKSKAWDDKLAADCKKDFSSNVLCKYYFNPDGSKK